MIVIHGIWNLYVPEKGHPDAPPSTVYVKRDSDGVDWYDYVNGSNFQKDTVKVACIFQGDMWTTNPGTRDASAIFPSGMMVLEIDDYTGKDMIKDFTGKSFNLDSRSFQEIVR
jgi:hypothetical protein